MDIQYLLPSLPDIKSSLSEWKLVTIRIADGIDDVTILNAAQTLKDHFQSKEGRIFIGSENEMMMIIRQAQFSDAVSLQSQIECVLPEGKFTIQAETPSVKQLHELQITVPFKKPVIYSKYAIDRANRRENRVLIADDDLYSRLMVKKGLGDCATFEVANGKDIANAYDRCAPDVLFLDIHMPGQNGLETLKDIMAMDAQAYVVMLTSDSSSDNVVYTSKGGAKGFLAKPFSKEKLQVYLKKCPTFAS